MSFGKCWNEAGVPSVLKCEILNYRGGYINNPLTEAVMNYRACVSFNSALLQSTLGSHLERESGIKI